MIAKLDWWEWGIGLIVPGYVALKETEALGGVASEATIENVEHAFSVIKTGGVILGGLGILFIVIFIIYKLKK